MSITPRSALKFADLPGRRSADPFTDQPTQSSLRIVDLERTEDRTAHRHPHSEEVVVVAAGHGEVWIEGVLHPIEVGDVVRIPIGAAHATIPAEGSRMELVCFFPHPNLSENLENTTINVGGSRE